MFPSFISEPLPWFPLCISECLRDPITTKYDLEMATVLRKVVVNATDPEWLDTAESILSGKQTSAIPLPLTHWEGKPLKETTRQRILYLYAMYRGMVKESADHISAIELAILRQFLPIMTRLFYSVDSLINEMPGIALRGMSRAPLRNIDQLPQIPAVYYVCMPIEILYIGCTKNLWRRWQAHHRQTEFDALTEPKFLTWQDMSENPQELLSSEAKAIAFYKPYMNKRAGTHTTPTQEATP